MLDNTLLVTISEKSDRSPGPATSLAIPGFIAAAISVITLALLFVFNPYASGYGAEPVSVLHFANALWRSDPGDWMHCYLVPIAVGAMVYFKRRELGSSEFSPAWSGLWVTLFGLAVYWLGFRADNIYLGYASFQILTAGLVLWFCGWKWFQHLFFAWAFLAFLYPVPFLDFVAFPLRMIMSQASVSVLNFIGIATIKSGTAILSAPDTLAGLKAGARFSVDVADPCSGIRSLFALMMVSALYGYFTQPGVWRKIFIFLCAAPLAILGNLARTIMLTIGTIAMGSGIAIGTEDDPSTFHMAAGFAVFAVALSALLGIGRLLETHWLDVFQNLSGALQARPTRPPQVPPPGAKTPRVTDEY